MNRILAAAGALVVAGVVGFLVVRGRTAPAAPPVVPREQVLEPSLSDRIDRSLRRIEEAPRDADARADLAMVYHAHRLHGPAEEAYRQALALRDEPRWRWFLARVLEDAGRLPQAEEEARRVVLASPDYAPARSGLARILAANAKAEEAASEAQAAVDRAAADPGAWLALAEAQIEAGRFDEANRAAEQAARLSGLRTAIHQRASRARARALNALGRQEDAKVAAARAGDGTQRFDWPDPWMKDVSQRLAGFSALVTAAHDAVQAGREAEAMPVLAELHRRRPEHPQVATDFALCLRAAGRRDEAAAVLVAALEKNPTAAEPRALLALVREDQGRVDEAMRVIDQAVAAGGSSADTLEIRGMMHYRRAQYAEAIADFDAAAERAPKLARLHIHAGMAHLERGDRAKARERFEKSIALDPSEPDAQAAMAILLLKEGDRPGAEAALRRAGEMSPESTLVMDIARQELNKADSEAETKKR